MNRFNKLPDEYKNILKPVMNVLRSSCVTFFDSKAISFVRNIASVLTKTSCILLLISSTFYIISRVNKGLMDLYAFAYILPVYSTVIQACFRASNIIYKKNQIEQLILELGDIWTKENLSNVQLKKKARLLKKLNFFYRVYYHMSIAVIWEFGLAPVFEAVFRKFFLNVEFQMLLPYPSIYPFDVRANWIVYVMTYIFELYSMFRLVQVFAGSEILMITLTVMLSTEFVILQEEFQNDKSSLKPDLSSRDVGDTVSDTQRINSEQNLKRIIKKHQKLIQLCGQLDDIFNNITFVFIFFITINIGVFGFFGKVARSNKDRILGLTGIVSYLVPLFNICYFAELLIESSGGIADSAYDTTWYKESISYKKMLLIVIARAQKPCALTALKFKEISLATFTSVLSNAWSYFSLLTSVYNSEK